MDLINVDATPSKARQLLAEEEGLSPALRSTIEVLLMLVTLLLNSTNSSKPPSSDPNRKKKKRRKSDRSSGGQQGRIGGTLEKADDPDAINLIEVDRNTFREPLTRSLPPSAKFKSMESAHCRSLIEKMLEC